MNHFYRSLYLVVFALGLSACDPQGGVDVRPSCNGTAIPSPQCKSGGSSGNNRGSGPQEQLATQGLYRDQYNDHVATVDSQGLVLFWDSYNTDKKLEQRAYVRRQVQQGVGYNQAQACQISGTDGRIAHNYSFEQTADGVQFNTSCGDARFYLKPSISLVMSQQNENFTLYNAQGDYLELSGNQLVNQDQEQAYLGEQALLELPAPYQECIQEYYLDADTLVILSSPNCEYTGFAAGLYQP